MISWFLESFFSKLVPLKNWGPAFAKMWPATFTRGFQGYIIWGFILTYASSIITTMTTSATMRKNTQPVGPIEDIHTI